MFAAKIQSKKVKFLGSVVPHSWFRIRCIGWPGPSDDDDDDDDDDYDYDYDDDDGDDGDDDDDDDRKCGMPA